MALMLRPLRVCDRQKRKRLRNRCFATATDINRCSVARSIEVTMVGRYRSIDRDYQGQLSRRLRSRVLMHAYATRGLGFLVCCAIISRQLGQGRQLSGGSPLFMINHRSSIHIQGWEDYMGWCSSTYVCTCTMSYVGMGWPTYLPTLH